MHIRVNLNKSGGFTLVLVSSLSEHHLLCISTAIAPGRLFHTGRQEGSEHHIAEGPVTSVVRL